MQREKDDFLQLISDNKGIIFKICNSYCANKCDRDDLAQEIIYILWKGSKTYNPDLKFSTWMYRVALNVAISFYRKNKRSQQHIALTEADTEAAEQISAHSEAEENFNLLQQGIAALKDIDKALIILYFEERSYKEIAEITGITETNVATKVSRIKAQLKQNITNAKK